MANEQTDPYAYKMYKTYARDLESQVRQLAREGLTPANRQNMLKMKQRYSSDIIPIEQAYKRRQELIDEQRKLQAQDNTLMFDNCEEIKLDYSIKMPTIYPNLTPNQRVKLLKKEINKRFKVIREQENISDDDFKRYVEKLIEFVTVNEIEFRKNCQ